MVWGCMCVLVLMHIVARTFQARGGADGLRSTAHSEQPAPRGGLRAWQHDRRGGRHVAVGHRGGDIGSGQDTTSVVFVGLIAK